MAHDKSNAKNDPKKAKSPASKQNNQKVSAKKEAVTPAKKAAVPASSGKTNTGKTSTGKTRVAKKKVIKQTVAKQKVVSKNTPAPVTTPAKDVKGKSVKGQNAKGQSAKDQSAEPRDKRARHKTSQVSQTVSSGEPTPSPKQTVVQQAAPSATATPEPPQKAPKSGRGLATIALLCSLLALAAGGYAAYQMSLDSKISGVQNAGFDDRLGLISADQQSFKSSVSLEQQNLASRIDGLSSRTDSVSSKTDSLSESVNGELKRMGTELSSAQSAVQTLQSGSNQSFDEFKADLGESVARWKLDELHSLLSQVNQYFRFTGDTQQAKAGLTLAQSTLATINNAHLEPVKTALAEDILLLDTQQSIDVADLRNRLMSLMGIVPSLTLISDTMRAEALKVSSDTAEQPAATEPEPEAEAESEADSILSFGKTLLNDLGGLVKHKRLDAPLLPSMDDSTRFVMYASLKLNVEGAMVALLRRDNEAYQAQLTLATEHLNANFDPATAEANSVLEALTSLQAEDVSLNVSSISKALDALNRIMLMGS